MDKHVIVASVVQEEDATWSLVEICQTYRISEELLSEMLDHGLFPHQKKSIEQLSFDRSMLDRIQSARRLHSDLGVNAPGVVLALELLDELERLRSELGILRRHVDSL